MRSLFAVLAILVATSGIARAACPTCPPLNVCSDLLHTDRPAYDACMAKGNACIRARGECDGSYARARLEASTTLSSPVWLHIEVIYAAMWRDEIQGSGPRGAIGLEIQALFGPDSWSSRTIPFRIGPFVGGGALFGSDFGVGGQLSAGVTALLWGQGSKGFGGTVMLSGGVVYDLAAGAPNAVGGLARVSVGVTTTGRSPVKLVSGALFLEGQYIPHETGDRVQIVLGVRIAPLTFPMILIPGAGDR